METILSRLSGGGCDAGGCRVSVFFGENILLGDMVSRSVVLMFAASSLSCRGLWWWGLL